MLAPWESYELHIWRKMVQNTALLEHCQCFWRKDVFLIFTLGSLRLSELHIFCEGVHLRIQIISKNVKTNNVSKAATKAQNHGRQVKMRRKGGPSSQFDQEIIYQVECADSGIFSNLCATFTFHDVVITALLAVCFGIFFLCALENFCPVCALEYFSAKPSTPRQHCRLPMHVYRVQGDGNAV